MGSVTRVAGASAVVALLVPWAATPALAHGGLQDGSPGPGDTVGAGSSVVRLEFLDLAPDQPAFVSVLGPDVEPRRVGEAVVVDGNTVCARTEPLAAGVHTLQYSVADATDGREIRNYQFEVTETGSPTEAGACSGAELPEATLAATIEDRVDPGPSGARWVGLGATAVAFGVVGAGTVLLVRRRRR